MSEQAEYFRDENGDLFIKGTKRADGTWRKPRKVKEGYVPQEEQPLYESKGKQWAKTKPDYPIGLAPDDVVKHRKSKNRDSPQVTSTSIPGLPTSADQGKSSKKSAKKKNLKNGEKEPPQVKNNTTNNKCEVDNKCDEDIDNLSQEEIKKKLRNLRKKLKDIEKLEDRVSSGDIEEPDSDQLKKLSSKDNVLALIDTFSELQID